MRRLLLKRWEAIFFGHSLFSSRNLSFEPSANLATPVNYRLGPGDEVIIDILGSFGKYNSSDDFSGRNYFSSWFRSRSSEWYDCERSEFFFAT